MNIALIGNSILRQAVQRNLVSFPSQVPVFMKRRVGDTPAPVDKEERIIQLYFVRNWQVRNICDRYRMSKPLVQKILTEWRIRAVAGGYIQDIDPESLGLLITVCEARQQEARLPLENAKKKLAAARFGPAALRQISNGALRQISNDALGQTADNDPEVTLPESVWELFASVRSDPAAAGSGV